MLALHHNLYQEELDRMELHEQINEVAEILSDLIKHKETMSDNTYGLLMDRVHELNDEIRATLEHQKDEKEVSSIDKDMNDLLKKHNIKSISAGDPKMIIERTDGESAFFYGCFIKGDHYINPSLLNK